MTHRQTAIVVRPDGGSGPSLKRSVWTLADMPLEQLLALTRCDFVPTVRGRIVYSEYSALSAQVMKRR